MPTVRFNQELVCLISGALVELAHSECPYCRYVDDSDIEKWLVSQLQKGVGERNDYWSELQLQRELEERGENVSTFNLER